MPELAQYLTADRVVILNAPTKADALKELVDVLAASDGGVSADELSKEVWKREELMSTGIGNRLAIPHVRMGGIRAAAMAVGVSSTGIEDYESLDKEPVHIIVLIAAPQGEHETYIRMLAKVADVLKKDALRRGVLEACDPVEIHRILTEGEV